RRVLSVVRRVFKYVEIVQLVGRLSPQWFQCFDGIRPPIVEEVAKTKQITRLIGIGRLLDDRLKGLDRPRKIVLPEIYKPDVQPNSRHLRSELLRLVEHGQSLRP